MRTMIWMMLLAAGAHAQTAAKKGLTLDGARRAIAAAEEEARARKCGGVIAVVDEGGNLMALERLDGTFAMGSKISVGKARTAVMFKKPTRFFEELINKGRTAMTALEDFTPLIGGIPIVVEGQIVGGVGVSGASSAAEDELLAQAAANAATTTAPVSFVGGDKVAAAFVKGMPLLESRDYKIHASHREGPGKAELHTVETDIIYVLDGKATLVTGGSVIDGKTVEPDEIRGVSISGGEARTLAKGDVVVVPKGVPHWFREVPGRFDYYVVKVRQ